MLRGGVTVRFRISDRSYRSSSTATTVHDLDMPGRADLFPDLDGHSSCDLDDHSCCLGGSRIICII